MSWLVDIPHEVLVGVASGDPNALAALARRLYKRLPRKDLEDPVEEALLRLMKHIRASQAQGSPLTVPDIRRLLGVRLWGARKDEFRAKKRRNTVNREDFRLSRPDPASDPLRVLLEAEKKDVLYRVMDTIEDPAHSVIALRFLLGTSYARIAFLLNRRLGTRFTEATVRSIARRTRTKILAAVAKALPGLLVQLSGMGSSMVEPGF